MLLLCVCTYVCVLALFVGYHVPARHTCSPSTWQTSCCPVPSSMPPWALCCSTWQSTGSSSSHTHEHRNESEWGLPSDKAQPPSLYSRFGSTNGHPSDLYCLTLQCALTCTVLHSNVLSSYLHPLGLGYIYIYTYVYVDGLCVFKDSTVGW